MEQFVFESDGGIIVRLNQGGEEIALRPSQPVELANVMGAKVRLETNGKNLTCEALVSECADTDPEPYRWQFEVKGTSIKYPQVGSLDQLISDLKIALNGRL